MPTATHARLIAPSSALASCVRAYVSRSTVGADLSSMERLNYFPASPLCGISWCLQGEVDLLPDEGLPQRLPTLSFFGPHTSPTVSRNPGPTQGFMLLLLPDALHVLTGLDVAAQVDRMGAGGAAGPGRCGPGATD